MMFVGLFLSSIIWLIGSAAYLALTPESVGSDKNLWWTLPVIFGPFMGSLMYGAFLI